MNLKILAKKLSNESGNSRSNTDKKVFKCMNSNISRVTKENSHQENIKVINILHLRA